MRFEVNESKRLMDWAKTDYRKSLLLIETNPKCMETLYQSLPLAWMLPQGNGFGRGESLGLGTSGTGKGLGWSVLVDNLWRCS